MRCFTEKGPRTGDCFQLEELGCHPALTLGGLSSLPWARGMGESSPSEPGCWALAGEPRALRGGCQVRDGAPAFPSSCRLVFKYTSCDQMPRNPGGCRPGGQHRGRVPSSQLLSAPVPATLLPPVAWPRNFSLYVSTAHSAAGRLSSSCPACPLQRGPRPPTLHPLHHIPPHLPLSTHSPPASSLPAVGSSGLCPWT